MQSLLCYTFKLRCVIAKGHRAEGHTVHDHGGGVQYAGEFNNHATAEGG